MTPLDKYEEFTNEDRVSANIDNIDSFKPGDTFKFRSIDRGGFGKFVKVKNKVLYYNMWIKPKKEFQKREDKISLHRLRYIVPHSEEDIMKNESIELNEKIDLSLSNSQIDDVMDEFYTVLRKAYKKDVPTSKAWDVISGRIEEMLKDL